MHVVLIQFCEETPESIDNLHRRTAFLGKYLSQNGHQVTWIKSGFSHDAKKDCWGDKTYQLNEHFKIIHVPGIGYKKNVCLRRYMHDWVCAKQMLTVLKSLNSVDVIVSAVPSVGASFFGTIYAQKHNIPCILDLRDAWPDSFPYAVNNKLLRFLLRIAIIPDKFFLKKALKKASAIVAMSHDMLNWGLRKIKNNHNPTEIFYLSTTEDVHLTTDQLNVFSKKYKDLLDRNTFKCFYISRWGRSCEPSLLLEVAQHLETESIDFILCGNGDYTAKIQEKAQGLSHVFLPGFVSHEEAYFLAKQCHCGISFISNEAQEHDKYVVASFPNKVFFQFMCGLPLVNGMRGELREVVEKQNLGLNFYNNNLEEIIKCIKLLKSDSKLRETQSKNSRQFFEKFGNPEKVYNGFVKFISEISKKGNL